MKNLLKVLSLVSALLCALQARAAVGVSEPGCDFDAEAYSNVLTGAAVGDESSSLDLNGYIGFYAAFAKPATAVAKVQVLWSHNDTTFTPGEQFVDTNTCVKRKGRYVKFRVVGRGTDAGVDLRVARGTGIVTTAGAGGSGTVTANQGTPGGSAWPVNVVNNVTVTATALTSLDGKVTTVNTDSVRVVSEPGAFRGVSIVANSTDPATATNQINGTQKSQILADNAATAVFSTTQASTPSVYNNAADAFVAFANGTIGARVVMLPVITEFPSNHVMPTVSFTSGVFGTSYWFLTPSARAVLTISNAMSNQDLEYHISETATPDPDAINKNLLLPPGQILVIENPGTYIHWQHAAPTGGKRNPVLEYRYATPAFTGTSY